MPNQYRIIHDAIAILDSSDAAPQAARNLLAAALPYGASRAKAVEAAIGLALQTPDGLSPQQRQTLLVVQIAAKHYRPPHRTGEEPCPRGGAYAGAQERTETRHAKELA